MGHRSDIENSLLTYSCENSEGICINYFFNNHVVGVVERIRLRFHRGPVAAGHHPAQDARTTPAPESLGQSLGLCAGRLEHVGGFP